MFNLEVMVFENDTIVRDWYSDETYKVYNGTVKFAFTIGNWMFCGYNDTNCLNKDGTVMLSFSIFFLLYYLIFLDVIISVM